MNQQFEASTPQLYRWTIGASGLVAVAMGVIGAVKPETVGFTLAGMVLFILLIILVFLIQVGTATQSNTLSRNIQIIVIVLSWSAALALILGAAAVIFSLLFKWPLDMHLNEDKTTDAYLASIKQYDLPWSFIERDGPGWVEKSQKDKSVNYTFVEARFTPEFLYLSDRVRNLQIRIPTQGGMMEWSLNERFKDCDMQYCWGDVAEAKMRR